MKTEDVTYANPATVVLRKLKEEEKKKKQGQSAAESFNLALLMDLEVFRSLMAEWLEACGLDAPITQKNSNDRENALGKRDIGLMIKKRLEAASPELYDLMVRENRAAKGSVRNGQ